MMALLYIVYVFVCIFLILVVLLQQGKGADLSVFGGGGTMTAFGARGAATMLHKLTVISFVLFIVLTIMIGILQGQEGGSSVVRGLETATPATAGDEATAEAEGAVAAEAETVPAAADGEPAASEDPEEGEDGAAAADDEPASENGG